MSAISLKSITGITSITTPAGVDNQLTLHNNNTTEAVKLDVAGNLHFHNHLNITGVSTASNFKTGTSNLHNTGLNVQDLDVDGHTNLDNVSVAGISTFSGILDATNTPASIRVAQDIQHKGDADTKITFPADNTISFDTAGSERLRIKSNGELEISPGGFLTIDTNPAATYGIAEALRIDDGGGFSDRALQIFEYSHSGARYHRIQFNLNTTTNGSAYTYTQGNYGGSSLIEFHNSGHLSFFTDAQDANGSTSSITPTERLRITAAGLVGINTSNPGRELDVYKLTNDCTIVARTKTAGAWFEANSEQSTGYYGLKLRHGNTEKWFLGSYGSNNLQLKTATANTSSLLEITSAGKIGIGTDDPKQWVSMNSGRVSIDVKADYYGAWIDGDSSGTSSFNVGRWHNAGGRMRSGGSNDNDLVVETQNTLHDLQLQPSGGKVSIGTDNPTDLLDVFKNSSTAYDATDDSAQRNTSASITIRNDNGTTNSFSQLVFDTAGTNQSIARIVAIRKASGTNDLAFVTEHSNTKAERLRIRSDGKVLIGNGSTYTPSGMLHIVGDDNSNGPELYLMVPNNNATDNIGALVFGNNVDKSVVKIQGVTHTANNTGDLTFHTSTTGTMSEKVRITSSGQVNIVRRNQATPPAGNGTFTDIGLDTDGGDIATGRIYIQGYQKAANSDFMTGINNEGASLVLYDYSNTTYKQKWHKNGGTELWHSSTNRLETTSSGVTITGNLQVNGSGTSVTIQPTDGLINFGMDGRSSLVTGTNSCYIFSGSGSSGDMPAGSLVIQSRSNVNRNIFFATGATPSLKWQIHGSTGALEEFPYNSATSSQLTSTGNGYNLRRVRNGQVPTGNSGDTKTLFLTSDIGDAGAYIMVIRSFEQNVTGGVLWSVRMVTSPFYVHSGSGNDGETVLIPYTYSGHANNATTQAGNGQGPITLRIHFYNGSAHTTGRIRLTFNGFNYTGNNCDYYLYKLIDV